jgi:hypothetical protein
MELDVQVEIAARRFAGTNVAVVNVMFPPSPVAEAEVENLSPQSLQVAEEDGLMLKLNGSPLIPLDGGNGDLAAFQTLVDTTGVFVLNMITTTADGSTLLMRTLMAENGTGRVISDSGVVTASQAEMDNVGGVEEDYNGVVLQDTAELAAYLDVTHRGAAARTLDPSQAN